MRNQKISEQERKDIISFKGKVSAYIIAKRYNVSHTAIYKIWKKADEKTKENYDTEILKLLIASQSDLFYKITLDQGMKERITELKKLMTTEREKKYPLRCLNHIGYDKIKLKIHKIDPELMSRFTRANSLKSEYQENIKRKKTQNDLELESFFKTKNFTKRGKKKTERGYKPEIRLKSR